MSMGMPLHVGLTNLSGLTAILFFLFAGWDIACLLRDMGHAILLALIDEKVGVPGLGHLCDFWLICGMNAG